MNRNDELKELFFLRLHDMASDFHAVPEVTVNQIWVTIKFGNLYTVTGRGYRNALKALSDKLDKLVE